MKFYTNFTYASFNFYNNHGKVIKNFVTLGEREREEV